ncbi:MAG: Gfo/Idh/MocA family oxidoreductase [Chloroflexi bacterium]|nr:Gfo/Idh/MocA family oxidoreductase [Chloroflexota bacterium]
MKKVRWGLLSTANINQRLIPAIRQSERGELVAVASRSQESAAAYAQQWHIPQTFPSYAAMLESDAIDAVYIPLPNHLHADWTIRALQAGKHVLCEKPFALTLAEVDRMVAVANETGMVLAEAFMYRHHPQTKLAGEMAHNGRLGDITLVQSAFNFKMPTRDNIRLVPEYGGGCLWDVGIYPVSLAQYIMGGLPETVMGYQLLGNTGVDEFFAGQLHYSNGRVTQISSSFMTPFYMMAEILGTDGRLQITQPFTNVAKSQMIFYPHDGDPEHINVPEDHLYLGEVEDMHAAILDDKPNYLTLSETRRHVKTLLALYESAQKQQPVYLE